MKRTPLRRRTPLSRGSRLARAARTVVRLPEPGEAEWKRPRWGRCKVCNAHGRVVLHHLVSERKVRDATSLEQQAAGIAWDRRNAIPIGAPDVWRSGGETDCRCHRWHHDHFARIPFALVSAEAREFAVEILGEGPAVEYWRRHYEGAP